MRLDVRLYFIFLLNGCFFSSFSQNTFSIKGIVFDKETQEPLSFATIYSSAEEGTISNESGNFILELRLHTQSFIVNYLGYETDTVAIRPNKTIYEIPLKSGSIILPEISVRLFNEKVNTMFFNSIKTSGKKLGVYGKSKSFRRTIGTVNDSVPAEFMEAFYNVEFKNGGIENFELKSGRVGIPIEAHFLNLDMIKVLERHYLFKRNLGYFPDSPLSVNSAKQLRKRYYSRIVNEYRAGNDTICEVEFEANQKFKHFSGSVFIRKSDNMIEKIKFQIDSLENVPFKIISESEKKYIQKLSIYWETGIDNTNHPPGVKYFHLIFNLNIGDKSEMSNYKYCSNTKFFFFDRQHVFEIPFYRDIDIFASNDYEKIYMFPYNQDFWNRQLVFEETKEEQLLRKKLERENLFLNTEKTGGMSPMLRKRVAHWRPHFQVDPNLMTDNTVPRPGTFVNPRKEFHAETFIFLDYNCFEDTVIFHTEAVLDYSNSYYSKNDPQTSFEYFKLFMDVTKIHTAELHQMLSRKYRLNCPSREELQWAVRKTKKNVNNEILAIEANMNSKNKQAYLLNLRKITTDRLQHYISN